MPLELITATPVIAYAVAVALALGHPLASSRRLRAAYVGG
jgi:hypothetical protein